MNKSKLICVASQNLNLYTNRELSENPLKLLISCIWISENKNMQSLILVLMNGNILKQSRKLVQCEKKMLNLWCLWKIQMTVSIT